MPKSSFWYARSGRSRFTHGQRLGEQARAFQRPFEDPKKLGRIDGLEDVIVCAQFDGANGHLGGVERGDEDDGQVRFRMLQLLDDLESPNAGHLQVGDDNFVVLRLGPGQSFHRIGEHVHRQALGLDEIVQGGGDGFVVFDDKNSSHGKSFA